MSKTLQAASHVHTLLPTCSHSDFHLNIVVDGLLLAVITGEGKKKKDSITFMTSFVFVGFSNFPSFSLFWGVCIFVNSHSPVAIFLIEICTLVICVTCYNGKFCINDLSYVG